MEMNNTKKEALIELIKEDPTLSTGKLSELTGTSRRYVRSIRKYMYERESSPVYNEKLTGNSSLEATKLALMAGLKKGRLPLKYREMLADIVASVEFSLGKKRNITVPSSGDKEAAVLLISDLHSGRRSFDEFGNVTFSTDVLAFKMNLLKSRVYKLLTKHLRSETIDKFVILLLGDIVDGSGIYPNQELNQDLHCFVDQTAVAVASIWDIITTIRIECDMPVEVYAVPGNHGRFHKYAPANNNFDYLVYQMLYMLSYYESISDVSVRYSTTTPYLNLTIKNYNIHIRHQAPSQAETPAGRARFGGWQDIHDWDIMCYAHLHHPSSASYQGRDLFMNGAIVGGDDLSERMAVQARPSQTLFGVDPDIGVSFRYNVYLEGIGNGDEAEKMMNKYKMLRAM